jgi:hypothetical protein
MRKTQLWIVLAACLFVVSAASRAQKPPILPGLYETTSSMTWQKSPFPQGMQMPPQAAAAFGGGPHTSQSCLTQAWIDRFGGPIPQNRGDCHMTNTSMTLASYSATLVCTGQMSGSGEVSVEWSLGGTAKGKVHFAGAMQMGPNATPVEWTNEFTSTYKGPDCGSVKPITVPADK